jgi:hypothetical protein
MAPSSDYKKAYDSAKQELADLLREQERIEKRLVLVRKSLQTFAELCENEGIEIEPSAEASYLLEESTLAGEIRTLLAANYNVYCRPSWIKDQLERLGHDLSKYANAQSTIQMVLKRMVESRTVIEQTDPEGKAVYAMAHPLHKLRANLLGRTAPTSAGSIAFEAFRKAHDAKLAREKAKRDKRD